MLRPCASPPATPASAADVVSSHVLAMFAPSFFTGHLIASFGAERSVKRIEKPIFEFIELYNGEETTICSRSARCDRLFSARK